MSKLTFICEINGSNWINALVLIQVQITGIIGVSRLFFFNSIYELRWLKWTVWLLHGVTSSVSLHMSCNKLTFGLTADSSQLHRHLQVREKNKQSFSGGLTSWLQCPISSKTRWEVAAWTGHTYTVYWYVRTVQHKHRRRSTAIIINRHFHCHLYEQKGYNRPRYASDNVYRTENKIFNELTERSAALGFWAECL